MSHDCQTCRKEVLLALPVYNEQKYLNDVLDRVRPHIEDVVVVDDGSTDDSKMILAARDDICVIQHPDNRGYGQSIIEAFQFGLGCGFQWLITMDCDLQHEPDRIPVFLEAIHRDDADIISGSRYLIQCAANDAPPAERQRINHQITATLNEKLGLDLTDGFCGFKAYRLAALEKLDLRETGYSMPIELWVQAAYHRLRIREIPVRLIYNDPNRSFGGNLDQTNIRLQHYYAVFNGALESVGWHDRRVTLGPYAATP